MNKYIILILILISFSCEKAKETNIDKLIICKVNLDIDSSVDVDCHDFDRFFIKKIKIDSIKDKVVLSKFETLLKKVKINKNDSPLDVRKKIIIFYKNKSTDTLCIDRFNISINHQMIDENNELLEYSLNL